MISLHKSTQKHAPNKYVFHLHLFRLLNHLTCSCPWILASDGGPRTSARNGDNPSLAPQRAVRMKLLYTPRPGSASATVRRALTLQPSINDSQRRLAFFGRMAVYSRSLASDPQPTTVSVSTDSEDSSSTSISSKTIIAGVLGAVAVLLICGGLIFVARLRFSKRPGLWTRFNARSTNGTASGSASSQKTLCNSSTQDGFTMAKKGPAGVMKGKASFLSESEVDSTPPAKIEAIATRMHSGRRPTIAIDTCQLPSKIRKSLTDSHNHFLEQKRGHEIKPGSPPMGGTLSECDPSGEMTNRDSMLSAYTLSLQLTPRPSTSLSETSVQTVSPIAFCDTPSNSHLPLALRPKYTTSGREESHPDLDNTKDLTSSAVTST